jgi:hypothetical protein
MEYAFLAKFGSPNGLPLWDFKNEGMIHWIASVSKTHGVHLVNTEVGVESGRRIVFSWCEVWRKLPVVDMMSWGWGICSEMLSTLGFCGEHWVWTLTWGKQWMEEMWTEIVELTCYMGEYLKGGSPFTFIKMSFRHWFRATAYLCCFFLFL